MRIEKKSFIAFIALGTVSLFADWTYEGGRSVLGPYLNLLGATSIFVGLATVGDFLSYFMRGVGGYIAKSTRSSNIYWTLIFSGYAINLFAVPLLAYAGNWELALALVVLERMGKGLRTPARDTILAEITEKMGKGKGFGLHELMDQVGAVVGPAFVGWGLLTSSGNYRSTYKLLTLPALIALILIFVAFYNHPNVESISRGEAEEKLTKSFWLYTLSMSLLAAGFIHWILIGYYLNASESISGAEIGIIYTVAMLSDALIAYPSGYLYDKIGPKTLAVAPALAIISAWLFISMSEYGFIILGSILWGFLMGMYETNMRVTVADVVPPQTRAYAYGIYGLIFGISWTIGNVLMGYMYSISKYLILPYIFVVEFVSVIALLVFLKTFRKELKGSTL